MEKKALKRLTKEDCERLICEHLKKIYHVENAKRQDNNIIETKETLLDLTMPYAETLKSLRHDIRLLMRQLHALNESKVGKVVDMHAS